MAGTKGFFRRSVLPFRRAVLKCLLRTDAHLSTERHHHRQLDDIECIYTARWRNHIHRRPDHAVLFESGGNRSGENREPRLLP